MIALLTGMIFIASAAVIVWHMLNVSEAPDEAWPRQALSGSASTVDSVRRDGGRVLPAGAHGAAGTDVGVLASARDAMR